MIIKRTKIRVFVIQFHLLACTIYIALFQYFFGLDVYSRIKFKLRTKFLFKKMFSLELFKGQILYIKLI